MNSWYEFKIPYFNEQFGSDWTSFITIVDDNVDYVMNKTYDLYKLRDVATMPVLALEMALKLRDIETWPTEDLRSKKLKVRKFATASQSKGTKDLYLDYAEAIVGIRGSAYNGYALGESDWGVMAWPTPGSPDASDRVWSTPTIMFDIYIDVKTTDSDLLDEIVLTYRQKFLLPAFYQIYLVDSSLNILRTV